MDHEDRRFLCDHDSLSDIQRGGRKNVGSGGTGSSGDSL